MVLAAGSEVGWLLRAVPLQVMTYGTSNDDAEWVRKQFYLGVHGVVVDDVEGVARALAAALA